MWRTRGQICNQGAHEAIGNLGLTCLAVALRMSHLLRCVRDANYNSKRKASMSRAGESP